jgi:hypothetical protein
VRGAVVCDVNVVIIIKMAENFKTNVLEGKAADEGEKGLGRYVFFIRYVSACIIIIAMCLI